jgi:hypothetical protein
VDLLSTATPPQGTLTLPALKLGIFRKGNRSLLETFNQYWPERFFF